jgi:eukaryotic-like serine/threonine-protein kinase
LGKKNLNSHKNLLGDSSIIQSDPWLRLPTSDELPLHPCWKSSLHQLNYAQSIIAEGCMSVGDFSVSSPVSNRDDYDIFISYSRRDKEFVSQLCEALTRANQKIWVDWNDIPPAEDWRQEIYRGIEAANNFVFIISPHSTSSVVCGEELNHAIKHGKRLVPIVRQDVGYENVHPELGRINWIFFREDEDFDGAFRKLISAVETDLSHVREQTHLLVRARKWEKEGRNKSYLLQGSELNKAEQWLVEGKSKQPIATALHREYINTSRRVETEREDAEMRLRRLTPQQVKNRQAILNKVRKFWVKGVLETSLHDQVLIELGLEERADAVVSSWNIELETTDEAQKSLPKGTKVIAIFDQLGEGRTLLILGEPGAGKTTILLELTRDLVNRAEQGLDYRIPIVFNLSSWAGKKQSIADWLVAELSSRYQVPKPIGQDWVEKQELLLLLDGLDEVKAEYRDSCVVALNDFQQNYAPEMVVCSRIKDYSALSNRLNFQSAIYLRSLTPEQVHHYLDNINADLTGLRALIEEDTALQKLAKSPLMLNIMVLAYEGVAVEDLPKTEVVEERRKKLLDAYIERMFRRPTRLKVEQRYSEAQTKRWLIWLAQRMVEQSQTVFFIEGMQPTWLQSKIQRIIYQLGSNLISVLAVSLIYGLITGLIPALIFGQGSQLILRVMNGLANGLSFGFAIGLTVARSIEEIEVIETLKWSWRKARVSLSNGLITGGIAGLIIGGIAGLIGGLMYKEIKFALINGVTGVLISGLSGGLIYCLSEGLKRPEIETKIFPNQSIWRSVKSAGILGLMGGLTGGLIGMLILGLMGEMFGELIASLMELRTYNLINALISGLINGLGFGLVFGLIFGGGKACIQHFVLRRILYRNGYIPWNYAHFLDYAADRIFLQKVGGGYIFIHRLLLEHFAQMELEPVRR